MDFTSEADGSGVACTKHHRAYAAPPHTSGDSSHTFAHGAGSNSMERAEFADGAVAPELMREGASVNNAAHVQSLSDVFNGLHSASEHHSVGAKAPPAAAAAAAADAAGQPPAQDQNEHHDTSLPFHLTADGWTALMRSIDAPAALKTPPGDDPPADTKMALDVQDTDDAAKADHPQPPHEQPEQPGSTLKRERSVSDDGTRNQALRRSVAMGSPSSDRNRGSRERMPADKFDNDNNNDTPAASNRAFEDSKTALVAPSDAKDPTYDPKEQDMDDKAPVAAGGHRREWARGAQSGATSGALDAAASGELMQQLGKQSKDLKINVCDQLPSAKAALELRQLLYIYCASDCETAQGPPVLHPSGIIQRCQMKQLSSPRIHQLSHAPSQVQLQSSTPLSASICAHFNGPTWYIHATHYTRAAGAARGARCVPRLH